MTDRESAAPSTAVIPPPPVESPPPPPARRWPLWLCLALVAALLAGAVPVLRGAELFAGADGAAARAAGPAPSPRPGDPPEVVGAWLRDRAAALLDAQARALLAGDEAGFVAPARGSRETVADLRRTYAALRELRVAVWRAEAAAAPTATDGGDWRLPVTFHHCFVAPDCTPTPVSVGTRWSVDGGRVRLLRIERSSAADHGPRPWEGGALVAATGDRTQVATTVGQRRHLPRLLRWAEQAAAVADRYAVAGAPPERYRVFLAGPREWRRWYGGNLPDWTSGYAIPLRGGEYEVVLNPAQLATGSMPEVLRHELTHVASLPAGGYRDARHWWLVEGLADVAGADGRSVDDYAGLADVRRLLRAGRWDGSLAVEEPGEATADWQVSARYGVAYLAVRHLRDRFGERDTLTFFRRVVHGREAPDEVSPQVFGQPWAAVHDGCADFVRRTAA